MEIKFKATRRLSRSCDDYRQIEKSGDLQYDITSGSDDVIHIFKRHIRQSVIIDCNKKTGEFSIKF